MTFIDTIKVDLKTKAGPFARKVAPLYVELGTKWRDREKKTEEIPAREDIENRLFKLIDSLDCMQAVEGGGGLEVYIDMPEDDDTGSYGIRFVVEDSGTFNRRDVDTD